MVTRGGLSAVSNTLLPATIFMCWASCQNYNTLNILVDLYEYHQEVDPYYILSDFAYFSSAGLGLLLLESFRLDSQGWLVTRGVCSARVAC